VVIPRVVGDVLFISSEFIEEVTSDNASFKSLTFVVISVVLSVTGAALSCDIVFLVISLVDTVTVVRLVRDVRFTMALVVTVVIVATKQVGLVALPSVLSARGVFTNPGVVAAFVTTPVLLVTSRAPVLAAPRPIVTGAVLKVVVTVLLVSELLLTTGIVVFKAGPKQSTDPALLVTSCGCDEVLPISFLVNNNFVSILLAVVWNSVIVDSFESMVFDTI